MNNAELPSKAFGHLLDCTPNVIDFRRPVTIFTTQSLKIDAPSKRFLDRAIRVQKHQPAEFVLCELLIEAI